MSKPMVHAKSSAKKFGGKPEDYMEIHQYMDSSKSAHGTNKHRAVFHSSFGVFILENVFGYNITNSDGKEVSVRDVAEQHVLEDLGFIPSLDKWLENLPIEPWMNGVNKLPIDKEDLKEFLESEKKSKRAIPLSDLINNPQNYFDGNARIGSNVDH